MTNRSTHLVWDWNGTLLDDIDLVVRSVNAVMRASGLPDIGADDYRTLYTRPVRTFYERLFGRPIDPDEWSWLDDVFHSAYRSGLASTALTDGAEEVLQTIVAAGRTQSLLSMWRHDELAVLVERRGLQPLFARIDGLRGDGGDTKAGHLAQHLRRLRDEASIEASIDARIVLVGDALDDAVAARAAGVECLLYDGGSHHRAELDRAGFPVLDSLKDALTHVV